MKESYPSKLEGVGIIIISWIHVILIRHVITVLQFKWGTFPTIIYQNHEIWSPDYNM